MVLMSLINVNGFNTIPISGSYKRILNETGGGSYASDNL